MATGNEEKSFAIQATLRGKKFVLDIIPFYKGSALVYRVVSDKLPELVLGLNSFDSWEVVEGPRAIPDTLLSEIGEKIEHFRL